MPESSDPPGCLTTFGIFLLIITPVYLMLRYFVGLIRQSYGFDVPEDEGPPLRICQACDNTVLEDDYEHCPYCGAHLPPPAVEHG